MNLGNIGTINVVDLLHVKYDDLVGLLIILCALLHPLPLPLKVDNIEVINILLLIKNENVINIKSGTAHENV